MSGLLGSTTGPQFAVDTWCAEPWFALLKIEFNVLLEIPCENQLDKL